MAVSLSHRQRHELSRLAEYGERSLGCTNPTMNALHKKGLVEHRRDVRELNNGKRVDMWGWWIWSLSDAGKALVESWKTRP